MKLLRIGLLGTARINSKIIPLLKGHDSLNITAVGSRSLQKATEYARAHEIAHAFEGYENVINCDSVDALYVSLPNSQHYEWVRKALMAGKHVLCEKPLALNASHAEELAHLAQENSLVLMEGFMYRHHRQTQAIKEILKSNRIGELQTARCSFHFTLSDEPNIRLSRELGGGALNDVGCYAVNMLNFIFADKPTQVSANALLENNVDRRFHGTLNYGRGRTAFFDCSFDSVRRDTLEIVGSTGVLVVDHPFKPTTKEQLHLISSSGVDEIFVEDAVNPYLSQFENFLGVIVGAEDAVVTLADSIATAQTLEMLRDSV